MQARYLLPLAILIATVLSAAPATAADFRVLDFAASCGQVASFESARGSSALDGRLPSGYQFAFRTREMDRDAVAVYACRDDRFFRGGYLFDAADAADATKLYVALKRRLSSELGAPYYDFASKEHRKKMSDVGATLAQADTQVAFWNAKNSEAHLSVAQPSGDRGWRVSLSYTAKSELDE